MPTPDMPCVRSRADRSDPTSAARAQTPLARRGHAQVLKIDERGEPARHTPRQRIVAEVSAHPKRTRPLGRCYAAPTATMCPYGTRAPYSIGWGGPLSTPYSHRVPEVPSESTATALLPHRPPSMPTTCTPPTCPVLGAEPADPTLLGRTRKRRWQEGGTYKNARLVSAESELGTLPVSEL